MSNTGPTTWFSGKSAPEDQRGPNPLLFVGFALLLYSPLGALVVLACYIVFNYYRVSHKVIAGVAALYAIPYFAGMALFSNVATVIKGYNEPYRHLFTAIDDHKTGGFIADNWWFWFTHQIWLSLAIGLVTGAAWTSWKWLRRPAWEDNDRVPGPVHRLRKRRAVRDIAADQNGPHDGATIGVDDFGNRIVQTEAEASAHTLLAGGSGAGKALDVDTPIPTVDGWKRMGDLEVGDVVFDETGQPTAVIGAFDTQYDRPCYEVVFSDGSTIVADAEHLWYTETTASRKSRNRNRNIVRDRRVVGGAQERAAAALALAQAEQNERVSIRSIAEVLGWPASRQGKLHRWLNATVPVGTDYTHAYVATYGDRDVQRSSGAPAAVFDAREAWAVVVDRLNAVLNDQSANVRTGAVRTTEQIRATLVTYNGKTEHSVPVVTAPVAYAGSVLPFDPYLLGLWLGDGAAAGAVFTTADPELLDGWMAAGYKVKAIQGTDYGYSISGGLHVALGELGVRDNKHVPDVYLRASESDRRALLAGLLDTDGTHERGARVSFTNGNRNLADAVYELAASLGYRPTRRTRYATRDGVKHGPYWVIAFAAPDTDVFRLERKRNSHAIGRSTASISRHEQRMVVDVRPVPSRPVRCITVASQNHLFLAGKSFIPTHNSTTMMVGIRDQIRKGEPVCVVDLKGATDLPAQLAEWSQRYGRRFLHWSITDRRAGYHGPADGPAFYDPIGRGDPSRKKDLLIGSEKWDVEYYKSVNENYLQIAFQIAELVPNPQVDAFTDLAALLDIDKLKQRAAALFVHAPKTDVGQQHASAHGLGSRWWEQCPTILDPYVADVLSAAAGILVKPEESERSAISNMSARVQKLRMSTAGHWLKRDPEHGRDIDLRRAADEGWVVVFSLDSSNYEATSSQVGGLIIQDLKTLSAELRVSPAPRPFHVYVDEFSAIGSDNILGMLARARDARMPTMLSTQALEDLKKADPAFLGQVLGIVNCFIVHRTNTEEDAEIFAGLTGKKMTYVKRYGVEMTSGMPGGIGTGSATGQGHIEQVEDYVVPASKFQDLKRGELVYIAKSPDARVVYPVTVVREDDSKVAQAVAAGNAPIAIPTSTSYTSPFTETDNNEAFPSPWPVMASDVDEPTPETVTSGSEVTFTPVPLHEATETEDTPLPSGGGVVDLSEFDTGSPGQSERPTVERRSEPRPDVIDPALFRGDTPSAPTNVAPSVPGAPVAVPVVPVAVPVVPGSVSPPVVPIPDIAGVPSPPVVPMPQATPKPPAAPAAPAVPVKTPAVPVETPAVPASTPPAAPVATPVAVPTTVPTAVSPANPVVSPAVPQMPPISPPPPVTLPQVGVVVPPPVSATPESNTGMPDDEASVFGGGEVEWETGAPGWDAADLGLPANPPPAHSGNPTNVPTSNATPRRVMLDDEWNE